MNILPGIRQDIAAIMLIIFIFLSIAISGNTIHTELIDLKPEYERNMRRAVFSLRASDSSMQIFAELMNRMPEYTNIYVVVPEGNLRSIAQNAPSNRNIKLLSYNVKKQKETSLYMTFPEKEKLIEVGPVRNEYFPKGSLWAQDLFEVLKLKNGKTVLIVPEVYKWYESERNDLKNAKSDNRFIYPLGSLDIGIRKAPFTFMGGNILFDKFNGRKMAFVGYDVIKQSIAVQKSIGGPHYTGREVSNIIQRTFNMDDVIVIGSGNQPSDLFHLDQAMVFLGNGYVGLTKIEPLHDNAESMRNEETGNAVAFLAELRDELDSFGYKIIDMKITVENLKKGQFFANGVPYTDMRNGQRTYLMPEFESDNDHLESNISALETTGYKVVRVPTSVNVLNGGIHCLINVID